jgi:hypothetical protein
MPDLPEDLVDVPPEEFIAARTQLAARLKSEGKTAEAAEVKKLRKPSVRDWVVDQVHRHHAIAVDALRVASADVARAQEEAITGGDREALRAATAARRVAVDSVERAIDEVLARDGRPAGYRGEVLATIESAVTADLASGAFGVRDDLELPERPSPTSRRDRAGERRAAAARSAIDAAEARVRRARDELDRAEAELEATKARYAPEPDG